MYHPRAKHWITLSFLSIDFSAYIPIHSFKKKEKKKRKVDGIRQIDLTNEFIYRSNLKINSLESKHKNYIIQSPE